jgi:lactate dehydrogenase-like 2-hydroxyacid dehydrogenase
MKPILRFHSEHGGTPHAHPIGKSITPTGRTDAMAAAKPVVFVTRKLPEAVEDRLRRDYAPRLNADDRPYEAAALLEHSVGAAAILTCATDAWPAPLIARLPDGVHAIATYSAGYEHIDLAAASARGITVTNTPDVLTEATADIAMLCLLGAARRAAEGETMVRTASWCGWTPTQLLGLDLQGATLGIVGMGRIGQAVAQRARAFGMHVHYHGRRRLPAHLERGAVFHPVLQSLLPACRFLSLHCPATAATTRMINTATLAQLPRGAVLVNTARGTLLDDEAVLAALDGGQLFAVGLDVYDGEPNLHPGYRTRRNCFLLPHLGSATVATRNAMGFRCLDNLDAILAGRPAPNALN